MSRGEFARSQSPLGDCPQCFVSILRRAPVRGRHGFSRNGYRCSEDEVYVHAVLDGAQPICSGKARAWRTNNEYITKIHPQSDRRVVRPRKRGADPDSSDAADENPNWRSPISLFETRPASTSRFWAQPTLQFVWTTGRVLAAAEISPGHYQFTDAAMNSPQRFYRVRSPWP